MSKYFKAVFGRLFVNSQEQELRGGLNFKDGFVVTPSEQGHDIVAVGAAAQVQALSAAKAAATGNITLSGLQTIDGVACSASDRVFLAFQVVAAENGPWIVAAGTWSRPSDFNANESIISGQTIIVKFGATYGGTQWALVSSGPFTLGTTALVWARVGGTGGSSAGPSPVNVVATVNVNLAAPGASIDGFSLSAGDRVLLPAQTAPAECGIWQWNGAAALMTRTADADADGDLVVGQTIHVVSGVLGAATRWVLLSGSTIAGAKSYARITNTDDKVEHDAHALAALYVKGLIKNATTSGDKLTNATLINAACAAAAAHGNRWVLLPSFSINIGANPITIPPSQGLKFGSLGGCGTTAVAAGYTDSGCRIIYEGSGDASAVSQTTGTSASSVAIGTGAKTFTIAVNSQLAPGMPIRFTATAGASGTLTGLVKSYYPEGSTCVIQVTAVTGSGTGTAWSYTTLLDQSAISAESHEALVLTGFVLEVSSAFAGRAISIDGRRLASDATRVRFDGVRVWCNNQAGYPDATYRPSGNMVAGIWGAAVNNSTFEHTSVFGGLQGICLRGVDDTIDGSCAFDNQQDAGVDVSTVGGDYTCRGEPRGDIAGFNYMHGGIRAVGCHGVTLTYRYGDAAPTGPMIDLENCIGTVLFGHVALSDTSVSPAGCAVRLSGCQDTTSFLSLDFAYLGFDVSSGSASIGLTAPRAATASGTLLYGSGISNVDVGTLAVNPFGIGGDRKISNLHMTNAAWSDNGVANTGSSAILGNYLSVMGRRSSALAHGGAAGASIELANETHGFGPGILFRTIQSNDATGHAAGYAFSAYDAAATNQQYQALWVGPDGLQIASPGGFVGPKITAVSGGHLSFEAKKLTNLADPAAAQDAATKAYADGLKRSFFVQWATPNTATANGSYAVAHSPVSGVALFAIDWSLIGPFPFAATVDLLSVRAYAGGLSTLNSTWTIEKGAPGSVASTSLTVTVTAGSNALFQDTTHSVSLAAGEFLACKFSGTQDNTVTPIFRITARVTPV